ncbi:putative amino acid ABC transporter permease [Rickettsiales endosymbiont of Paramecium tredecaurelia]|uniref:amino acid ABC transporter permease n=1 Tax=Candidatus Sarmatiella mevalonica TaxID=2770581 RepID=UPI00192472D9|nr:amino acid ABC transporter permease [Candidatus Sarmatiella mevalonica]MBL3284421.1 putative amino acid ABC transporter permease [Candidatus Sarmatiella mevalonica]
MNIQLLDSLLFIGHGILDTARILCSSLLFGAIGGLLLVLLRYHRLSRLIAKFLISIIRGTPLILQLNLVYFSAPTLFNIKLSVFWAAVAACGINSSAYIAEIFRAGMEVVPSGQFEAAKTLRIPLFYTWKDIILPQVLKNILPALINEVISLLKETAIVGVIGGLDIMRRSQILGAYNFNYFTPLCIAGFYYYFLVTLIEFLGKRIEKKCSYDQHQKTLPNIK